MRTFRFRLVMVMLLGVPIPGWAQEGIGQKEQERIQQHKEKEEKKKLAKQRKNDHKRHMAMQDKATRKRIRQNTKRANKRGSGLHRDPFLKRIFTR